MVVVALGDGAAIPDDSVSKDRARLHSGASSHNCVFEYDAFGQASPVANPHRASEPEVLAGGHAAVARSVHAPAERSVVPRVEGQRDLVSQDRKVGLQIGRGIPRVEPGAWVTQSADPPQRNHVLVGIAHDAGEPLRHLVQGAPMQGMDAGEMRVGLELAHGLGFCEGSQFCDGAGAVGGHDAVAGRVGGLRTERHDPPRPGHILEQSSEIDVVKDVGVEYHEGLVEIGGNPLEAASGAENVRQLGRYSDVDALMGPLPRLDLLSEPVGVHHHPSQTVA